MSQLSKQALKVANNTSFPNNNTNYITPAILREYNTDIIDSMVDEIPYGTYTQSVDASLTALNQFTASASGLTTGSLLITASAVQNVITFTKGDSSTFNVTVADTTNLGPLNDFTASQNTKNSTLASYTASVDNSLSTINSFTSSQLTKDATLATYTASVDTKFSNIGSQSASWDNTSLNAYTASNDTKWSNLGAQSGSWITESETGSFAKTDVSNTFTQPNIFTSISASSFVSASAFTGDGSRLTNITASVSLPILDEGIPQGNAVSMNFTGSGISATIVGGTAIVSVNTPDSGTVNNLTASFNAYTASTDAKFVAVGASTASLNAFTASFSTSSLVSTASFNAYTASNDQKVNSLISATGSYATTGSNTFNGVQTIRAATGTPLIVDHNDASPTQNTLIGIFKSGSAEWSVGNLGADDSFVVYNPNTFATPLSIRQDNGVTLYGTLTASLQEGYTWVGNGSNVSTLVATSSFGTPQIPLTSLNEFTASQETKNSTLATYTASVDTKFATIGGLTGSYATTGSNIFVDKQTISANGIEITGSVLLTPASVSTNAQYVIPFISGSTISKDSVDTLFYNPSFNQLLVSSSATGVANISPNSISFTSGSGAFGTYSAAVSKNGFVSTVEGVGYIAMQANPSKTGAPSLTTSFNPAILGLSSSAQPYVAIELQQSGSGFSDGRVTFPRNVAMLQNLEITGSLTASLQQGYTWVGDASNKTILVSTSSFGTPTDLSSLNAFTASQDTKNATLGALTGSYATTGSNVFVGNQTISGSLRVTGSVIGSKVGAYDFDTLFYGSQLGGTIPNGTFFGYGSTDYQFILGAYNGSTFDNELKISADSTGITFADFNGSSYPSFLKLSPNTGANPKPIMTRGLEVTGSTEVGTFTASLQQGYAWVGDANGRTTTVATSSFGGGGAAFPYAGTASISGSLQVTGSMSGLPNELTVASNTASIDFTKGNFFSITLPASATTRFEVANVKLGQTLNIQINQPVGASTGSVAFATNILFAGGNDYQATATGSAVDLLTMVAITGSNVLATSIKNFL